jgi:hypothetical protein
MDDVPSLGSLDAFEEWPSPRPWGPSSKRHGLGAIEQLEQIADALGVGAGDRWRATFGPGVIADFVKGLRDHPAAVERRFSRKAEAYPVVLGCVNVLTSAEVVDALLSIMADPPPSYTGIWPCAGGCVIVDKAAYTWPFQPDRLSRQGVGIRQGLLHAIQDWGPPDGGRPPVITPHNYEAFHERVLTPVRVVGSKANNNEKVGMLHAKLAVCCAAYTWEGEMGGWDDHLMPMSVWMGSANWTALSGRHLEFGAWTTDPALAEAALEFMAALIKTSEPWGSRAQRPSPEMVEAEWDDAGFAELAAMGEPEYESTEEVP